MEYERAKKAIGQAKSIAVFSHTNPDGDTLGSAAALYLALSKMGKECALFCEEPVPQKYLLIPSSDNFQLKLKKEYDLAIAVDCADIHRLGALSTAFSKFKKTVNIDHHHDNDRFALINIIEDAASAAEVVLDLIEELDVEIDKDMALALFIGLCTDTGSFRHRNTTPASFAAAALLAGYGADASMVAFEMFKKSSLARTKLLGKVLSRTRSCLDGKVTLLYTLQQDFEEFGLDKTATELFVDYSVSVEGTEVGVALCQYSENVYKASLRSGGRVNVADICSHFGGGGHRQAAGCIISGLFEDVIDKLLRQIGFCL